MKVNVVCVGKIKERFYTDAVAEYAKRLTRFCDFRVIEVAETTFSKEPAAAETERVKRAEGARILEKLSGYVVALDLAGKQFTSEELATFLSARMTEGNAALTFVIGGSYGLSDEVLSAADLRLSFGRFTYPHQLMRVILSEQIYRAFMLRAGCRYHK